MRLLHWVGRLLTENLGWKLLALVLATLIWLMVASEPELSTFTTVQVEFTNLPDDLEIASEPVTAITLELRGPAGELRAPGESVHPAVILDMSTAGPGQRTFPIQNRNVRLARGVHLVSAIPSEVRFDFERRVARPVPVAVRITGDGRRGYMVARVDKSPAELQIVGPESRVARISAAVTDPVDVSSVVGSSVFHVNAFVEDPFVRLRGSPTVTVTVTMRKQ